MDTQPSSPETPENNPLPTSEKPWFKKLLKRKKQAQTLQAQLHAKKSKAEKRDKVRRKIAKQTRRKNRN